MTETLDPMKLADELSHTRSCGYFDDEVGCTCCLTERKALATEQEMHRAWRKRAKQAEAELIAFRASSIPQGEALAATTSSENLKGYADSLRQQAKWIIEAVKGQSDHFSIADVDTDELMAAAELLENLSRRPDPVETVNREELLRGLAAFFSESVHHVWSSDEVAECLTGMIDDASFVDPLKAKPASSPDREEIAQALERFIPKDIFGLKRYRAADAILSLLSRKEQAS